MATMEDIKAAYLDTLGYVPTRLIDSWGGTVSDAQVQSIYDAYQRGDWAKTTGTPDRTKVGPLGGVSTATQAASRSATGGATLNNLQATLDAVNALFGTRIEATRTRRDARIEELKASRDELMRQEAERTRLRIESESADVERRKASVEEGFYSTSESLNAALADLSERLTAQRDKTLEDVALAEEQGLEDVEINALERGIFRSGIRKANEAQVMERADLLEGRALGEFEQELGIGQRNTEMGLAQAERARDLDIADAIGDYESLLRQLQFELEAANTNLEMQTADEISAIMAQAADQLVALQIEQAQRKADQEAALAAQNQQLNALGASASAAGGGTYSGSTATPTPVKPTTSTSGGGGYVAPSAPKPTGYVSPTSAGAISPVTVPKNVMYTQPPVSSTYYPKPTVSTAPVSSTYIPAAIGSGGTPYTVKPVSSTTYTAPKKTVTRKGAV